MKHGALALGGLTVASGTASAGKERKKRKKRKRKLAKAGWVLTKKSAKAPKHEYFRVICPVGTHDLPAGCGPKSANKPYVKYKVRLLSNKKQGPKASGGKKGGKITYVYRRKNQPQLKPGLYRIKNVNKCGKRRRLHFKRVETREKKKKPKRKKAK